MKIIFNFITYIAKLNLKRIVNRDETEMYYLLHFISIYLFSFQIIKVCIQTLNIDKTMK